MFRRGSEAVANKGHGTVLSMTFWGVRGSAVMPGPKTLKYGGNTTCIEVNGGCGGASSSMPAAASPNLGMAMREEPPGPSISCLPTCITITSRVCSSSHRCSLPAPRSRSIAVIWAGEPGSGAAAMLLAALLPLSFDDVPARVRFHGFSAGEESSTSTGSRCAPTHSIIRAARPATASTMKTRRWPY